MARRPHISSRNPLRTRLLPVSNLLNTTRTLCVCVVHPWQRHLLIIDGHSSHVTARFIAYYITSKIDLFLLPLYSSHKTQLLDLSIFGPLKIAINLEVDRIFRHSTTRLPRVDWTLAYIKARARCFKPSSIESSFRKARIYPFNPKIVLSTLAPPLRTPSPGNQVLSQISDVSRILRARSSPRTPKSLNLR